MKKATQKARKQSRKGSKATKIMDPVPFQQMNLSTPTTVAEAEAVAAEIFREHRGHLEV